MDLSKLSDQELGLLESFHGRPLSEWSDQELQFMEALQLKYNTGAPTVGDYGKAALQTAGEVISLPGRLGRGAALAVTKGELDPDKTTEAFLRGLDPKYQSRPGEGVASTVGKVAGDVAGLTLGGAVAKAPKLAGPLYRMGRGAIEGAALAGGEEAAKEGNPLDTAAAAITGGIGGGAGAAGVEAGGLGLRAIGKYIKGKAGAGVGEEAMKAAAKAGSAVRGPKGSSARVGKAAQRLISRAETTRADAGKAVGAIRKQLGLPNRLETEIDAFLNAGAEATPLAESVASRVKAGPPADPQAALSFLDELKHDLDKLISWNKVQTISEGAAKAGGVDEAALLSLRDQVGDQMAALPIPGVKALRDANRTFSAKSDAYSALFGKVKTQGSAEELLKTLAKSPANATGRITDVQKALKELGATRTAKSGAAEAAVNLLKTAGNPEGPINSLVAALSPAGRTSMFRGGSALENLGDLATGGGKGVQKVLAAAGRKLPVAVGSETGDLGQDAVKPSLASLIEVLKRALMGGK